MPRVLIVEDDAPTRDGLARLLARHGYEVEAVADGPRALECARQGRVDVVLMDLNLPGLHGLELLRLLRQLDATLPVVVLTGEATLANAVAALRHAGAYDFLCKPVTDLTALQAAVGSAYVHGLTARDPEAARPRPGAAPARPRLSEREWALLRLVAQGCPNEAIAEAICLSPKTVRNYLSALYDKLGVSNRTQAALLYRSWDLG
ncbi:MAG: response regulator transcription factor [Candidatus Sericytochromatia bacterium]|nr:response regulator transcription factor [Candidatus Sericytochromatia bacterium]